MTHMQQFDTHTHCVRLERFGLESEGRGLGAVYISVLRPARRSPVDLCAPSRIYGLLCGQFLPSDFLVAQPASRLAREGV